MRILSCAAICLAALAACSDDSSDDSKTYKVGDLYEQGGVRGVVYELTNPEGRHGMIVSLDQVQLAWASGAAGAFKTGATDDYDGQKNLSTIEALADWQVNYPAFAWCAAKNRDGGPGWVLPAYYQLRGLYEAYAADPAAFDKFLTDRGGEPIAERDYWSSTEDAQNGVFAISREFDTGFDDFPFKTETAYVRAVRAF